MKRASKLLAFICVSTGIVAVSCKARNFNSSQNGPHYENENLAVDEIPAGNEASAQAVSHPPAGPDGSFLYNGSKNYVKGDQRYSTEWASVSLFPQPESDPEKDKAEAAKVCSYAASVETKKLCEYVAIRKNHLDIMSSVVDDVAGCSEPGHTKSCTQDLNNFQWCGKKRGWLGANCDTCASVQSTSIVMSGAANISRTPGTLNLVNSLYNRGWKPSVTLHSKNGTMVASRSEQNCKGLRPGDVAFATMLSAKDIAEGYGDWPAHAFMFYKWVGEIPENWDNIDTKRRAIVIDNVRKWNAISRLPTEEALHKVKGDGAYVWDTGKGYYGVQDTYKHRRPIFFYDSLNDYNDCWFYMRGPTKIQ